MLDAIVVGAGPAGGNITILFTIGLAAVASLLDKGSSLAWIDPLFNGGRLSLYKKVPSNTKVGLFIEYANGFESFRKVTTNNTRILESLRSMDQERGCTLGHAVDLVVNLTDGLTRMFGNRISVIKGKYFATIKPGKVESIDRESSFWRLKVNDNFVKAPTVILATGSHPRTFEQKQRIIPLEIALDPDELAKEISSSDVVGVIGSSHSAILVLRSLAEINPAKIKHFYREPLKYAKYKDGWILHDNTGLKGEAAEWAANELQNVKNLFSFCSGNLEEIYQRELPECTCVIQCIGFERNYVPIDTDYDPLTGNLINYQGIYGIGIAFPELVRDPLGNEEFNVGMFKFMKYAKRII